MPALTGRHPAFRTPGGPAGGFLDRWKGQVMESEREFEERFFARAEAIAERAIAPLMLDGTVAAIGREMVKDMRNTFHEVFFGRPEHHGEIGSPLNPVYSELAEAKEHWQEVMTPSELARDDRPYQADPAIGQEHAMQRDR